MSNPKMVSVVGGSFKMGSNDYHDETPHQVTLSSFYIGQFTVTQREWVSVMEFNPSEMKGDDLPVTNVSWNDVQEFIQKLNELTGKQYRLPTEAEWEFAARGGNQSKGFEYAGSNNRNEVAWHRGNSKRTIRPVGKKKPNELGIYDMSGNVWEWCQDWYGEYSSTPQVNPKGPDTGKWRILRGGSWLYDPEDCRVAFRTYGSPGYRYYDMGFRLAHDFETF